jgi:gliding motility-associated-like protein
VNFFRTLPILAAVSFVFQASAQSPTLRINEVSQGESGSMEYVELVVTGPPVTNCAPPACLDIRGWILDDNNGYFSGGEGSGTGVAAGAIRFSNNALWECVAPGTIILIYNNEEFDAALIPPVDQSTTDGNCKLVLPVSSALFERHESLPGTSSMVYAATGWVSGGQWSRVAMANGNDSFQVIDPANTTAPVHGVSWGNNNTQNVIYFAGGASGTVFSCLNTSSSNFSQQSNWSSASAASAQTPGLPNSPQNAALITSMNPTCGVPLSLTIDPNDESCSNACNGSASTAVSGGVAPYTYSWSTGAVTSQETDLCAGTYDLEVTDANGCSVTETFTIAAGQGFTISTSGDIAICSGESTQISATGANTYSWNQGLGAGNSFTVNPAATTTYVVTGTLGSCTDSDTLTVSVAASLEVNAGPDQFVCTGTPVTLTATGAAQFSWNHGVSNGQPFTPPAGTSVYMVTGTSGSCSGTDEVSITVTAFLEVDAGADRTVCSGEPVVLSASGANSYVWDQEVANGQSFVPLLPVNVYTVLGTSGTCFGSDVVTIYVQDCASAIEMPNIFTPNGDGQNDFFEPVFEQNITVRELTILNRWGNTVHAQDAQSIHWNGEAENGQPLDEGVYFWKLVFVNGKQQEEFRQGFVQLIRN